MLDRLAFAFPPYHLSGVVYGCLLNDKAGLAALGDAVHKPPYNAPPKAPVLFLKPRNTLALCGARIEVDESSETLALCASLGIVIGRPTSRVSESHAAQHIAGLTLVADLSTPHDAFYRPSVRMKARDGSCVIGPRVVPYEDVIATHASLDVSIFIDGTVVERIAPSAMVRSALRLVADISDFLTLEAGDIVMLGTAWPYPIGRPGQQFCVEASAIGRLEGVFVASGGEVPP